MTDGSHDAELLVDAELDLVTFVTFDLRGRTHLRAALGDLRAWPIGATVADDDDDVECSYCPTIGHDARPIGPYLPPQRPELNALRGTIVTLVVTSGR